MLIEVIITTLLVALIIVATLAGFDGASKESVASRWQDEAELLAAQSQEQLRTDSATALDALESNPHVFTREVDRQTFTVTQEAKPVNAKATTTGCSGTESSKENGANIEISSAVTWPEAVAAERPPVKQLSIITPPVGSALEVDVTNGGSKGVPGVTAVASFLPSGGSVYHTAEGTTGSAGCIVLTGLDTTSAKVEIPEVSGFVTTQGTLQYPTKEVSIAPNITTPYKISYDKGGRITAHFTYKGLEEWEGKKVKGDTFVVSNTSVPVSPNWEIGSTSFKYESSGEENYQALTGVYATTATTATGAKYAFGDLFPFQQPWSVSAGDCPANKTGSEAEVSGGATVNAGEPTAVKVPMSLTELTIWTGSSSSSKESVTTEQLGPVKITNNSCSGAETPDNSSAAPIVVHEQSLTSSAGHLENPFQPFGSFTLCLVDKALKKTYTTSYSNTTVSGSAPQIYLKQRTESEWSTLAAEESAALEKLEKEESEATKAKEKREKEETEAKKAKETREKEETEAKKAKETRETAEANEKKEHEATEKADKKKWEEEEKSKKISKATRESDEKTLKTKLEKEETEHKKTRKEEEEAAPKAKEKREKEETEAKKAKEKREKEESEAPKAKETREQAKTADKKAKEAREKEEATQKASGVTVKTGESC